MRIFKSNECSTSPRADMFLPVWLLGMGIFFIVFSIICLSLGILLHRWGFLAGFVFFLTFGIAACFCWKNQTARIIDEDSFEYTTFLGRTTVYRFSEIKSLRENRDSYTLFVGDKKVHIESIVNISEEFLHRIQEALGKNHQD